MKDDVVLAGRFRFWTLGEILQMLGSNGATGVLSVRSQYASEPGEIYFSKGMVADARCLSLKGIEAVHALFGWSDGEFEFRDSAKAAGRTINQGLMEIIMDGARMLDDGQITVLGPDATAGSVAGPDEKAGAKPKLQGIPILRMPIKNQKLIVAEEAFTRGHPIENRGVPGPWLYVILNGFANVFSKAENGQARICRLGPGALLGEVPAFINSETCKTISAMAAGSVSVGVFDPAAIKSDFAKISYQLRRLCQSLDNRWAQVTQRVVEANAGKAGLEPLLKDTRFLMQQGEPYKGLHLITEGQAWVVRRIGEGFVPIARLGMGDFVGDIPFMGIGHEPNASAVAVSRNFRKNDIDLDRMQAEYDLASPLVKNFVEHIANCVSVTTMVACDLISPAPFPE